MNEDNIVCKSCNNVLIPKSKYLRHLELHILDKQEEIRTLNLEKKWVCGYVI